MKNKFRIYYMFRGQECLLEIKSDRTFENFVASAHKNGGIRYDYEGSKSAKFVLWNSIELIEAEPASATGVVL